MITSKTKYYGKLNTVFLGQKRLAVGGQGAFYLHDFEGDNPNPPRFSLDVWDYNPTEEDLPLALQQAYVDVKHDAGLWAKKCFEEYGADIVTLHLKSTSPNNQNLGAAQAVKTVERVLNEVDGPLIIMGVDDNEKDIETLSAIAEEFSGQNLSLGPVTARNYKRLGAQALAYNHAVIALSPTDFNLAKQLNILLCDLGLPQNRIIMDPTAAALGYGMEYCYSTMEQLQVGALVFDDQDVQQPMVSFFGENIWKTKEASQNNSSAISQGVMMEVTEAVCMIIAGAGILGMCHPQALAITRNFLNQMA